MFVFRASAVRLFVSVCERACTGACMCVHVYAYASVDVYACARMCMVTTKLASSENT